MFRNWQNNLQNLNGTNEAVTFFNGLGQQRLQFRNKIINRVKYLRNLNDVYYKENKNFAKIVTNLKRSNSEINKTLKGFQMDVKLINLLEQNNKVITQYNKKMAENAKRIEQNLKELYNLNEFRVYFDEKSQQIILHARQILVNLQQQGLSSGVIKIFSCFTADQSHVGDQCSICMENYDIGRNMMRLDCDGKHTFCKVCIDVWFADHNTCPLCRHKFNK